MSFIPTNIANCIIWLDAADQTTIVPTTGTTVTSMASKGSIALTVSSTAGGSTGTLSTRQTTVNGLNTINVPASSVYATTTGIAIPNQARTYFMVFRVDTFTNPVNPFLTFLSSRFPTGAATGYDHLILYNTTNMFIQTTGSSSFLQIVEGRAALSIGNVGIVCFVQSATSTANNVVTLNGTQIAIGTNNVASAYSTAANTLYLGNAYAQPYVFCEYIFYNAELSVSQRQQVEAYLGQKWGVSSIPTTNPFFTPPPAYPNFNSLPFLPNLIPNCIIWLDAADQTTLLPTSGTSLTSMTSKGSISLTVSSTAGGSTGTLTTRQTTINGLNTINVAASSVYATTTAIAIPNQARTVFMVFRIDTPNNTFITFLSSRFPTGTATGYDHLILYNGTTMFMQTTTSTNFIGTDSRSGLTVGRVGIVSFVQSASTLANNVITLNGTQIAIGTNNIASTYPTSANTLYLGTGYAQAYVFCEYIFYNAELSPSQRQQVEGYLAWKWGIQTSLPATHPYFSVQPTNVITQGNIQTMLVTTPSAPGTLQLPSTFSLPGRILVIKDRFGTFNSNALTLTTNNANQVFDYGQPSTLINTQYGWQTVIANTNNRWTTIGGTVLNTIITSSINTTQVNTSQISTANILTSTLVIRDQFQGSTTLLYTSSSLLYYNNGVTSTILAGTRQSFGGTFLPTNRPFLPNQITGLNLWLDGADLNTVTVAGGFVRQWRDKSINNTVLSNSTGTPIIQTFNGLPSIYFNGSTRMQNLSYTRLQGVTNVNWFVVANIQNTNLSYGLLIGTVYANNFFAQNTVYVHQNNSLLFYRIVSGGSSFNVGRSITAGSFLTNSITNFSDGTYSIFVNGTPTSQTGGPTGTQDSAAVNLYIGNDNYPDESFITGNICECLLYTTSLTTIQRQQLEGYLAWKWSLTQSLPANHPYRNTPP